MSLKQKNVNATSFWYRTPRPRPSQAAKSLFLTLFALIYSPQVQHKYARMGRSNPDVKPPLDKLKAVVKDWPESFKMKDELVRVLEQMLSYQPSDRPTAEQLLLLPLLSRFVSKMSNRFPLLM
jgi:hypothetical protein